MVLHVQWRLCFIHRTVSVSSNPFQRDRKKQKQVHERDASVFENSVERCFYGQQCTADDLVESRGDGVPGQEELRDDSVTETRFPEHVDRDGIKVFKDPFHFCSDCRVGYCDKGVRVVPAPSFVRVDVPRKIVRSVSFDHVILAPTQPVTRHDCVFVLADWCTKLR